MSHELVFRDKKALMLYVTSPNGAGLPWHRFGQGFSTPPSLEETIMTCGFDREIRMETLLTPGGFVIPDRRAVLDNENRYLGSVGKEYKILQDAEMVRSLSPWIDGGFASVESSGMLSGGSRIWLQLKINDAEFSITPGDSIQSYVFVAQGHDMTLGLVSGYVSTRIICNNTLSVALKEDGIVRIKHRGEMVKRANDLQSKVFAIKNASLEQAEMFRFLATKKADTEMVDSFIAAVVGKEDKKRSGPGDRIRERFLKGIGNKGQSLWHLLNAVTEDVSYSLGNNMKDDVAGDKEGRALGKLWFGSAGKSLTKATQAAVMLASGKTPLALAS